MVNIKYKIFDIHKTMKVLEIEIKKLEEPIVGKISKKKDPFLILVSCMISLRTKDAVTAKSSLRLFNKADTPEKMIELKVDEIAKLIYPAGFYKQKAQNIYDLCKRLVLEFNSKVPNKAEVLMSFKGVGLKTTNLVLGLGFGIDAICVDTHVHRITNRWGYVKTKTPEKTEAALRKILPREYWIVINDYLVPYGQFICLPRNPKCDKCRISGCPQRNKAAN